ncbi:unnamed protein product [Arabidopsis arenosa]|uniref:Terpene synthase n=1 Tax=Arabidopsis arenosa TaxID=38785 RepID=A0A8S2ATF1_ARAAE|nr:unnamed protein product [Arabidopsis arenosa]
MESQHVLDYKTDRTFKKLQPSQWADHFLYIPIDELNEIEETLTHAFEKIDDMIADEHDLYTISIFFWVFRTYGHNISSDVFKRFKGEDGKFMDSLTKDAKGMLSLYEAAHLRTTKDCIMDESLSFTTRHLESLAGRASPHLSRLIHNALGLSQHWNMEIIVALEYITFYEHEEDHDETILKFSKLNFKLLQLLYLKELKMITKWYKELDFASKLPPYFRDRIVELHFFVISIYASISEAESLANSLERWAPDKDMDRQPAFLKFVFKFILDVFKDFERELGSEGRSYSLKGTLDEFKRLVKANLDLAKWAQASHVPSFDDYMEVGEVEITMYATMAGTLMGMGHIATEKAYEWLKSRPKIIQSLSINGRLMNDMAGFEDDMSRGYVTTGINCYMKQYGVTKNEAFRALHKMRVDNDKIVNEELLMTKNVPRRILKEAINCARMTNVAYGYGEGLTHPEDKIKDYIISLYNIDQIHL